LKELLFTVTKSDCDWQYFRVSGAGGQHRDKTSNGCRVIHKDSGAKGESREHREQVQNKRAAFKKMAETPQFQTWAKMQAYRIMGIEAEIEAKVDNWMQPENIIIEYGPFKEVK
jgi:protein subunit release factor B